MDKECHAVATIGVEGVSMDIRTVGVVGAGIMGTGIAQTAAQAGYNVILRDIEDRILEGALKKIERALARSVDKGKMSGAG